MDTHIDYDLKSTHLPRLMRNRLRLFVRFLEDPATRGLLLRRLVRESGIARLRGLNVEEFPAFEPQRPVAVSAPGTDAVPALLALAGVPRENRTGYAGVLDYAEAYRSGKTTPEAVAERLLAALADSETRTPAMRFLIAHDREDVLRQARAATQRWRSGGALGPFDGVPVAVKDDIDQVPYKTTLGTRFLKDMLTGRDATAVARLRAAGAILIGKANMHEVGAGVTGHNPHHGTVRNPYHPYHHTGGSSSGSAALVAAGLCPVTLGTDGGGSVRIPAAFCGAVGLKPTYGRVSEFGSAIRACSIASIGPIAATAQDAALAYAVIAGSDPEDWKSLAQPSPTLEGFDARDLSGLTLGVYWPWFEHATPAVVEGCKALLKALEGQGAQVREITIPDLDAGRIAHVSAIVAEIANGLDPHYAAHHWELSLETRISVALGRFLLALDYVQAQRIRTRMTAHFQRVLETVDVIVTPVAGCAAPPITLVALPEGEVNLDLVTEIMRFAFPANLIGLPAIAFPAGYDAQGLPIGFQAIGRFWQEHVLLRLANVAERLIERRLPQVHYRLLPEG